MEIYARFRKSSEYFNSHDTRKVFPVELYLQGAPFGMLVKGGIGQQYYLDDVVLYATDLYKPNALSIIPGQSISKADLRFEHKDNEHLQPSSTWMYED